MINDVFDATAFLNNDATIETIANPYAFVPRISVG